MKKITITILMLLTVVLTGCFHEAVVNENVNQNIQNSNTNLIVDIENGEIDTSTLKIVKRIPEGIESGSVDKTKVVHGGLKSISIFFNNSIDQTSISSTRFYALWGIEDKIPGRIIYNDELREISLVFDKIIQGGNSGQETRITIVIDSIKDIYGNFFGKFLYNIDIGK